MDIVGLGMATVDVLVRLHEMPTWQAGARLGDLALDGGGPVGTALAAASRLGAQTGFIGVAGDDRLARLKLESLREHGVDTSRVVVQPHRESQVVVCYVHAKTGERVFCGHEHFSSHQLCAADLDRAYVTAARCLHLDGSHIRAARQAARWMREAGRQVVLDLSTTRKAPSPECRALVADVDVLIAGSGAVPALTGESDLWAAAAAALALGPAVVVQTEGADGSYTVTREERFHTPAFDVQVVDTTGAGDVFHGAYIFGLLQEWDLRRTASFASAAAALNCTRFGGRAGAPTLEEVEEFQHLRSAAAVPFVATSESEGRSRV